MRRLPDSAPGAPGPDWNPGVYDRVSGPQLDWGTDLIRSMAMKGEEVVVDVGCGTGRVTQQLVQRLPGGYVIALDRSAAMVHAAKARLPSPTPRVSCIQADAVALPFESTADIVFSTATFHWIRDHDRLFRSVYMALKHGGLLTAQCGGGPNLARFRERCAAVMRLPPFAPWFVHWTDPWEFATAETTSARLRRAGFTAVRTHLFPSPVVQPDAATYREFIEHVVCGPYLTTLPTAELRDRFLSELVARAARESFVLDYWRLNMVAEKRQNA